MKHSKTPFYQYTESVINGKKIVGKYERLMVERFYSDLDKGEYNFDYEKGERVVKFASMCRHHKGALAGQSIILEPFQQFTVIQKYGWLKDNGTRRFSTAYKKVARGNGKTTELAIEADFLISKDGESGAQVYCGATKEEQARILTNDAGKILQESGALKDHFQYFKTKDTINRVVYPADGGFIAALGKDSKRNDGFDPHAGQLDEYHAHPTNEVRNIIESGMVKRSNPLMNIITTAGFNKHGPCYKFEQMCKKVLEGDVNDESLLISIYDLDSEDIENDNWHNHELWIKANPNLGVSVNFDFLKSRLNKSINEGGEQIVDFKTKNLNIWTDASTTWIQSHIWNKCSEKPITDGQKHFFGGDLSTREDYSAASFVSESEDGYLNISSWGFIPEETFKERVKKESAYLYDWVKDGFLLQTPGNVIDYDYIEQFIKDKWSEISCTSGALDPWNAVQLIQRLNADGKDIASIPNNMGNLSEPAKYLERKAKEGKIRHGGNGLLSWMISNCMPQEDGKGNLWINKEFPENKIDMVKSLLFAIRAMMVNKEDNGFYIDSW